MFLHKTVKHNCELISNRAETPLERRALNAWEVPQPPNPSKIDPQTTKMVPQPPNPSKIDPQTTKMGPKIDRNGSKYPFGAQVASRSRPGRHRDQKGNSGDQPFWTLLADLGRSKGRFWSPGGSRKESKIDLVSLDRHLGGPRKAK